MAHILNIPKYGQHSSKSQSRRVSRTHESKKWISERIDTIELLKKEGRINRNEHLNDLTKVAWTKTDIIATKYGDSASILTAMADNGSCTQTITGNNAERAFLTHIKRITGTGKIEITMDGTTWTNVTRKINSDSFTQVNTEVKMLDYSIIGFRLGIYRDEIAVCRAQSVEL